MMFKSLLILFLITICIEMNSGANENSHFWTDDFIIDPYSPEEETFQGQPGSPVIQQANVDDVNEEAPTNIDQERSEIQAKEKFESEYEENLHHYIWPDLLNDTYDNSRHTLCYKLWKNPVLTQRCGAHKLIYFSSYRNMYRIIGRNVQINNYFDNLNCICPIKKRVRGSKLFNSDHYFFVIPSQRHQHYYYILRYIAKYKVEIFDMRKAEFDPTDSV